MAATVDLSCMRRRQQQGELAAGVDPAVLRLVLFAAVVALFTRAHERVLQAGLAQLG